MPNQCRNVLEVHGPDDAQPAAARSLLVAVFLESLRDDESLSPERETQGDQNSPVRTLAFSTEQEPPLELLADLSDKFPRHEFRLRFENQVAGFRGSACFLRGVCRDQLREGAGPREQGPEPRQPTVEGNTKRGPKTPLPMPTSLKEAARQHYERGFGINYHEIYPEFVMSYRERLQMSRFFGAYEVIRDSCSAEDQLDLTAMEQAHREYLDVLAARGKAEHDLRQAVEVIRRPGIVVLLDAAGQAVLEQATQLLDGVLKRVWSDLPPDPSSCPR
jgi:hypothetical protein